MTDHHSYPSSLANDILNTTNQHSQQSSSYYAYTGYHNNNDNETHTFLLHTKKMYIIAPFSTYFHQQMFFFN